MESGQAAADRRAARAADMVAAIGTPGFADALFEAATSVVDVDHVNAFCFDGDVAATTLLTTGRIPAAPARNLGRAWVARYFRFDPNLGEILALQPGARERASLRALPFAADRIGSLRYREFFFERTGIRDKLSLVFADDARRYYLNLYRMRAGQPFVADDARALEAHAALLAAALSAHARSLGAAQPGEGADVDRTCGAAPAAAGAPGAAPARLTARERDIRDRLLVGMSTEGVALDLGISPNTVKTLKKRLYGKLGVSSLNELHALALRRGHG